MSGVQPLRIGMIGAGFVAQVAHLQAFSNLPGVELHSLAEPQDELREAVADRFGVINRRRTYRDILTDPDVDAVIISLPRYAQAIVVKQALQAKPAVLSEKPMAMTLAEAETLVDIAKQGNRIWATGYMKRYDAGVVSFRELLREARDDQRWGRIVDVAMRDFCATYASPIPPHFRKREARPIRYPESSRAPDFVESQQQPDYDYTVNVLSHDINLLRWMFPEIGSVTSFHVRHRGVQQACFDAGSYRMTATVGPADLGFWDQRLDVTFERARLSLDLPSPMARQETSRITITRRGSQEERVVPPELRLCAFDAQAKAFVDAVLMDMPLASNGVEGLADLQWIESLWRVVNWRQ